jgi:hypothetical protein
MSTPTPQTILTLSDMTADVDQFVTQFQTYLQTQPSWVGNLTTTTAETLIELAASVGAFAQGRIIRAAEDAYAETAQSDSAILSITQMQGLRIARYLPGEAPAVMQSPVTVTLAPLTQFTCAGYYFFNRDQISLTAGVPQTVSLFEGQVFSYSMNGLGTERQTFVGSQDSFVVSDRDTIVQVNGTIIPKAYGGLWNFDGLPGYSDQTMSDGRLLLQFGNYGGINGQFGTIPMVNDTVVITFPVTSGASGNSFQTSGKQVTVSGFPLIYGTMSANPTGGANDNPVVAYKNVASGGFGTYQSAVTKSQYQALIATYPGIIDAVTQAQREIDPSDYRWMNVVRVSALTASTWSPAQIQDFLAYCQSVTMYSTYFLWQDPIPVPQNVALDVYVFNSAVPSQVQTNVEAYINTLFGPRPGLLQTNFYISDLVEAAFNSSPGMVSYVVPTSPGGAMIVTSPTSPQPTAVVNTGGGTLTPLVYAYGISTDLVTGDQGYPSSWVFPQVTNAQSPASITLTWPAIYNASDYKVWGRSPEGTLGLLATVAAGTTTWTDNGSVTPTGGLPSSANYPIRYNTLASLTVNVYYAERQQRIDNNPTRLSNG